MTKEPKLNYQDLKWAEKKNNYILTYDDENYPQLLKEISGPPSVLFVSGDPKLLSTAQIAMVGSRNPSHAGKEIAYNFAQELVAAGLTITSGFAVGIDTASHLGALDAQGRTIAVVGTGLERTYPLCNLALKERIIANGGALVSEFSVWDKAEIWHFPLRNRIISGLSLGVVVVEAALRSGSLITARLAGEQGREVFAVPGSIGSSLSHGCHSLLKSGAKLVETTNDILEELKMSTIITPNICAAKKNNLDHDHKKLLECVGFEPTPVDVLIARSGIDIAEINAILLNLEMQKLIQTVPGGYIKR